jgi:hypothetical protein
MTDPVLSFVNQIRTSHGLPPALKLEPGIRRLYGDCALARTIGGGALVTKRHTDAFGRRYRHPRRVISWIRRFDRGKYPELVTLRPTRTSIQHLDFEPGEPATGVAGWALAPHAL